MTSESAALRRSLREVGITSAAINAVWPEWWSSSAESSPSALAELRYTVARRLGLSPSSLFEGTPRFVWRSEAKFKGLTAVSEGEQSALTSFAVALAKSLTEAAPIGPADLRTVTAERIRSAVQERHRVVKLDDLLAVSWGLGVPVVHLAIFPLDAKRMHAVTAAINGRYAILLARSPRFPAQDAFTVAHELGHLCNGHLGHSGALLDSEDPSRTQPIDSEEASADTFALTVLTGHPQLEVQSDRGAVVTSSTLAAAAVGAGSDGDIDPSILALCFGYSSSKWRQAMGALKILEPDGLDVAAYVNRVAMEYLDLTQLSDDSANHVRAMIGIAE